MGSSTSQRAAPNRFFEAIMNKTLILILAMALVTVKTAPQPRRRHPLSGGYRAFGQTFYPNQGLKNHGTTKLVTGLGLLGIGALTGNQDITNVGSAIPTLGIGTKIAAHLFG